MEAQDAVNLSLKDSAQFDAKKLSSLVILKAQIFHRLGYLEFAHGFFSMVMKVLDPRGEPSNLEALKHLPLAESSEYLECILGCSEISIELGLSPAEEILARLTRCEEHVHAFYPVRDCEPARRIQILRLKLATQRLDFGVRQSTAETLSQMYQNYDHYRLLRCEDFMQYVVERVGCLVDNCRFDSGLVRVENILEVLDKGKNTHWARQFEILRARCLIGLRRAGSAHQILQNLLKEIAKEEESHKLRDFRLFCKVNEALAETYLAQEDYKNSMKCQKYVLQEYYENSEYFKTLNFDNSLKKAAIFLTICSNERKISNFEGADKYWKSKLVLILRGRSNYQKQFPRSMLQHELWCAFLSQSQDSS